MNRPAIDTHTYDDHSERISVWSGRPYHLVAYSDIGGHQWSYGVSFDTLALHQEALSVGIVSSGKDFTRLAIMRIVDQLDRFCGYPVRTSTHADRLERQARTKTGARQKRLYAKANRLRRQAECGRIT